jgi:hypothetical protein
MDFTYQQSEGHCVGVFSHIQLYSFLYTYHSTVKEQVKPQWFLSIIQFCKKNGQPEKTIFILRQGVETAADYAPFHIQFGDYCRKEGITFLARQEYQRALA